MVSSCFKTLLQEKVHLPFFSMLIKVLLDLAALGFPTEYTSAHEAIGETFGREPSSFLQRACHPNFGDL